MLITVFFCGFALLIGVLSVMRGIYSFSTCQPPVMPTDSAAQGSLDEVDEQFQLSWSTGELTLPATTSIEGSVGIGQIPTGFGIEVELKVSVPGLPVEQVEVLVQKAHIVCPYSNATRGNIDVKLVVA